MKGRLCRIVGGNLEPINGTLYALDTPEEKAVAREAIARAKIGLEPDLFPDAHDVNLFDPASVPVKAKSLGRTLLDQRDAARVEGYWRPDAELKPSDGPCRPYHLLPWPVARDNPWPGQTEFLAALDWVERRARAIEKYHQMGYSTCRLCGRRNGTAEFFDPRPEAVHGWRWPEGFAHYVEEHNVEPSNAFLNYIMWRSVNLSL